MAERPDSFELVETVEGLEALRPDWERLLALNPAHVQAQTPDWCLAAWRHVAAPRGARLATVVGRRDGAVDLIWPLVAQRRMLWPVLRPLDAQAADYCDVLCLPDPMAPARVAGAIAFARRRAAASVLSLPYARMDGQLGPVAACLWPRRTEHRFSRIARTGDGGDWESFARSLSRSQRRKVQQRRRRLEALGTLAAGPVEDADAVADAFDWLASTKSAWLGQRGLPNLWIRLEEVGRALVGEVGGSLVVVLAARPREGVVLAVVDVDRDARIAAEAGLDGVLGRRGHELVLGGDVEHQLALDRLGLVELGLDRDAVIADRRVGVGARRRQVGEEAALRSVDVNDAHGLGPGGQPQPYGISVPDPDFRRLA